MITLDTFKNRAEQEIEEKLAMIADMQEKVKFGYLDEQQLTVCNDVIKGATKGINIIRDFLDNTAKYDAGWAEMDNGSICYMISNKGEKEPLLRFVDWC